MNSSFILIVKPANSAARKRKTLGVRVRGINITDATKIAGRKSLQWQMDLSNVPGIRDVFRDGQDYDFQFFFNPDNPSDKATIRFIETQTLFSDSAQPEVHTVRNPSDLVSHIKSNATIFCDFDEERSNISRAFPATSPNTQWANVHDGKELVISNLSRFELAGTTILADPRYAWVLNFIDCTDVALRKLTIGHTKSGYCQGGVLRFQDCANITIERCSLFGSGTYGVEFVNCRNIEIIGTTIKECTYGAVRLTNVSDMAFRECEFKDNKGFELFEFDGTLDRTTLQDCKFLGNEVQGAIFCFTNQTSSGLYVHNSSFIGNRYAEISSLAGSWSDYFDHEQDNVVVPTLWAKRRG